MKNYVCFHSDHWLFFVGAIFVFCVMFFPGGVSGTVQKLRRQGSAP